MSDNLSVNHQMLQLKRDELRSLVMDFYTIQTLSALLICGFHFVLMQNKSSRSEESLFVFTYRNIQSEAAEVSSNAPRLINQDPSAVEETSREQNHRRLPYIELHSWTQCVRVLLSLHENGESTKTCVSGQTEQLTQLFLQILLRGSNRQPQNNQLRHETVSCASHRDTLTDLRAPNFTDILHLICQRKY